MGNNNPNWKGGKSIMKKKQAGLGTGNAGYRKGKYYERKTRKILEKEGYYTIRSAASKGIFDIVAIKAENMRLLQIKAGASHMKKEEREKLIAFKVPLNVTKEIWVYSGTAGKYHIDIIP